MGYQLGKMLTCDSCGQKVFLEKVFAPNEEYEAPPRGWTVFGDIKAHMCPACTKAFGTFVSKMFGITNVPTEWQFIAPSNLVKPNENEES